MAATERRLEYLLDRGADLNWIPTWENLTPLDAAERNGFNDIADWLRTLGAQSARPQDS